MMLVAILVAELEFKPAVLTDYALQQLFDVANRPIDRTGLLDIEPSKWDIPQVHAMNTMRLIFTESRLAQGSWASIEPAFELAIKGFSNDM
jgi:hypothetical protein